MKKFEAVIFDMDGVLIDSMVHWIQADRDFFKMFNITLTDEMIRFFSGRSEQENTTWLKQEFGLRESVEELIALRRDASRKIYTHHTEILPGVEVLIRTLKALGFKLSIASGATHEDIKEVIERFNWHDHFEHLVSTDHVGFVGKPDPAIYLHTARMLKVEPGQCVVLEDAENGVVAAKRAGMSCIAVPDPRWSIGDFSAADLTVEKLSDTRVLDFIRT